MHTNEIECDYATLKLEDGIIYGAYKNVVVDLKGAKQLVKNRKKITNCKTYPLIIDVKNVKEVTKEARDYFASKEGEEFLSAAAIVSGSILTTFLANFVIQVSFVKTNIPTRLFKDKEKALEWIKSL